MKKRAKKTFHYRCKACNYKSKTKKGLNVHITKVHQKNLSAEDKLGKFLKSENKGARLLLLLLFNRIEPRETGYQLIKEFLKKDSKIKSRNKKISPDLIASSYFFIKKLKDLGLLTPQLKINYGTLSDALRREWLKTSTDTQELTNTKIKASNILFNFIQKYPESFFNDDNLEMVELNLNEAKSLNFLINFLDELINITDHFWSASRHTKGFKEKIEFFKTRNKDPNFFQNIIIQKLKKMDKLKFLPFFLFMHPDYVPISERDSPIKFASLAKVFTEIESLFRSLGLEKDFIKLSVKNYLKSSIWDKIKEDSIGRTEIVKKIERYSKAKKYEEAYELLSRIA